MCYVCVWHVAEPYTTRRAERKMNEGGDKGSANCPASLLSITLELQNDLFGNSSSAALKKPQCCSKNAKKMAKSQSIEPASLGQSCGSQMLDCSRL